MATSEFPRPASSASSEPIELASANPDSLHKVMRARRSEYVRQRRIRVKVGTWNVAACPGTDKDLVRWFVDGEGLDTTTKPAPASGDHDNIGLYVLGLQEVNQLTAPTQYLNKIFITDTSAEDKWKAALEAGLPEGYKFVAAETLGGLLILVYASSEVFPLVSNVSTTTVSAGLLGGYIGNKGAVCCRIILGESTNLLFVNCHLASGVESSYVSQRIWQVEQIQEYARFDPIQIGGVAEDDKGKIGDEDFAFWFGDLNSRLDRLPGDEIRRLLMLHTRGEYDLSKKGLPREDSLEGEGVVVQMLPASNEDAKETEPAKEPGSGDSRADDDDDSLSLPDPDEFPLDPSEDPASLQTTLQSLLPHDQLRQLMKDGKVFSDGWREGPINFLPSYKYDVGTVALFDSSEKRRPPSWCDRILYRTRKYKEEFEKMEKEKEKRRKKDEEMKAQGLEQAGEEEDVLFSYDPDNDGEEAASSAAKAYDDYDEDDDGNEREGAEGSVDRIHLDFYTSHQRITSSDHKPVSSVFTIDCDAVDPSLRAMVHGEVVRQLDRAENEGRPVVTIIVDYQSSQSQNRPSPDQLEVDFGDLRFGKRETCSMTLANTGGAPATISFVEKPTTDSLHNLQSVEWLTTTFFQSDPVGGTEPSKLGKEVTLEPGETVNAIIEAFIGDINQSRALNEGKATLDEVLVLRVKEGRDHFIPVRAEWSPTCIGRSIKELLRVPELVGIRAHAKSLADKKGTLAAIPIDVSPCRNAPRELVALTQAIDMLTDRVLADEQMLEECDIPGAPGWPFDESTWQTTDKETRSTLVADLIDTLDQGQRILEYFPPETPSTQRLEAVAEVFVLFLRGLTDGIVTVPIWDLIEQRSIPAILQGVTASESTNEADKGTILDVLQDYPEHHLSFLFVTTSLARTAAELAPVTKKDLEAIKNDANAEGARGGFGATFRRSMSFRRGTASSGEAAAKAFIALNKRRAKEKKYAEAFGSVVCRGPNPEKDKDRRVLEERQRALVELFIRKKGE